MADWTAIASLATAGGTLVLAVATFASVRSSNRSARSAERAVLAGIRPVLVSSRLRDPPEKVGFMDDHWIKVEGGRAVAEITDDVVYLAIALKNVGPGLAVLDRWQMYIDRPAGDQPAIEDFRRLTRDIYVPAGDFGFWQGAFRDREEPLFDVARTAIVEERNITIDLLYSDHEGGQHTITRFVMIAGHEGQRICTVSRHWNLDRSDPR